MITRICFVHMYKYIRKIRSVILYYSSNSFNMKDKPNRLMYVKHKEGHAKKMKTR